MTAGEKKPKTIEIIDGIAHEVTIFSGDGKLYDLTRQDGDPVRQGSRLLRPIVEVVDVADPPEATPKVTTADIPTVADDPNRPWSML